jgi:hypothetical protein
VVDSGRDPSGEWAQTVPGPSGIDLIMATSDTATESGAIGSYSAFDATMSDWRKTLVSWRCGLSEADRHRFGAPPGWNCRDLEFFISRISFDQLGPNATRLTPIRNSAPSSPLWAARRRPCRRPRRSRRRAMVPSTLWRSDPAPGSVCRLIQVSLRR